MQNNLINNTTKMPSLTRDQKFKKSFPLFFNYLCSQLSEETQGSEILQEYELKNIPYTSNQKILGTAHYELCFPRKIVDYHIDTFLADNQGNITPPGPVMKNQFIPEFSLFRRIFIDYFSEYYISRSDGLCMANVGIDSHFYENKNDGTVIKSDFVTSSIRSNYDLKINLYVNYYKSELPFPTPLTTKQEFQKKCIELEKKNRELSTNFNSLNEVYHENLNTYNTLRRVMRTERKDIENKYKSMFEKMQRKFAEYYSQVKEKDDCPVCYEIIESNKLKVPGCCHTICTDCSSKCNKCPICREQY